MNELKPHFDDGEVSACSGVIGPLVVPGDASGFIAFGPEPPENHLRPLSYAKNSLSQLGDTAPEWTIIEVMVDSGACDTVMPPQLTLEHTCGPFQSVEG